MRIKRGNVARSRRKRTLKAVKGFRGAQHRLFTIADRAYTKAGKHAYADRRIRRRNFRRLWIVRINAAVRELGMRYSEFIKVLHLSGIDLDRKSLADLAMNNPDAFKNLFEQIKDKAASAQAA